jgi:hypothetical protein
MRENGLDARKMIRAQKPTKEVINLFMEEN